MKIAGLDIGTTGCKCTVFDEKGHYLDRSYRDYPVRRELSGHEINAGTVVAKLTTNEYGEASTEDLPLGTYNIVERQAPNGYILIPIQNGVIPQDFINSLQQPVQTVCTEGDQNCNGSGEQSKQVNSLESNNTGIQRTVRKGGSTSIRYVNDNNYNTTASSQSQTNQIQQNSPQVNNTNNEFRNLNCASL